MKNFNDFSFSLNENKAMQAMLEVGGFVFSVVYDPNPDSTRVSVYSNIERELYEVAVFFGNEMLPLQPYDDVLGWQSVNEIDKLLEEAQTDPDGFIRTRVDAKAVYNKEFELS